jgi:4a-hydroxytetrahydrobiopterin dehydratase
MRYTPLTDEAARMKSELASWNVADGWITKEFDLGSFGDVPEFIAKIVAVADVLDHHPDVDIRYPGRVLVKVSTHAIGGLSTRDVDLAVAIDAGACEAKRVD